MSYSPESVEAGGYFRWQNEQLVPVDLTFNQQSQLTLFHHADEPALLVECLTLLKDISTNCVFRCRKQIQGVFWDVFDDYSSLQLATKGVLASSPFDYLLWPEQGFEAPRLLLFDMDSTFITIEVIDELAKRHNVGEQVASVTEAAMQGELDFAQSLLARVACLKGLSESVIGEIAASLPLSQGVDQLVEDAGRNNCAVAIVSGGFMPFVEKLRNQMGLYRVKANQLKIVNGELSGEVEGPVVDAKAKADFLLTLCESLNLSAKQVMAIGDGANDLLMMHAAGFNLAYRAKPKVQQAASGRINVTHLGFLAGVFDWPEK